MVLVAHRVQFRQPASAKELAIHRPNPARFSAASNVASTAGNGVPADMMRLEELLRPLVQKQAPIVMARKLKTRWVRPQVLVEIDFPNAAAERESILPAATGCLGPGGMRRQHHVRTLHLQTFLVGNRRPLPADAARGTAREPGSAQLQCCADARHANRPARPATGET